MKKRILINTVLILIALATLELWCFYKTQSENLSFQQQANKLEANNTKNYKTNYKLLQPFNATIFRNSFLKVNSNKKPIIWFGCSFAEGAGLNDNQTPCYKISELTGRSCINKAKGATGTQFMYYQLQNDNSMNDVKEADFIIYTFIWNHLQRLYNYQINPLIDMHNLRYKMRDDKLVEIKPVFNPIYSSFFAKRILNTIVYKQAKEESYNFKLFNKIMKESYIETQERYPNSKFIFLEFPDLSRKELPDYEIKELEYYGIIVVRVKDLIKDIDVYDKKYWLPDNIHPTEELWNLIMPELNKKYLN